MPDTDFVGRVRKRKTRQSELGKPFGAPTLADFPSREFYGRVVIEVWDYDEFVFHTSYPHEQKKTLHLLEQAILTLQSQDVSTLTALGQPDSPVEESPKQNFLGKVVVEVWDGKAKAAASGSNSSNQVVGRAVRNLLNLRSLMNDPRN